MLGGLVFREETVKADRNLQTEMFRKAELFRKAVETRTAPALDGRDSDVLAAVKPHSSEEWATADTGIDRVAAMYSQALYESRLLDEQISNLAISIKEAIGERQGIVGNTGWVATWRANKNKYCAENNSNCKQRHEEKDYCGFHCLASLGGVIQSAAKWPAHQLA